MNEVTLKSSATAMQASDVITGPLAALAVSVLSGRPVEYASVQGFFERAMQSYPEPAILVAKVDALLAAWNAEGLAGTNGEPMARLEIGTTITVGDRKISEVLVVLDNHTVQSFTASW